MSHTEPYEAWPLPPETAPGLGPQGRYRLAMKLGEGGMASVYRAWDTVEEQWVAVKVLLPEYARRKKLRKRFENEARTMTRLDHRHIIKVLDVGVDGPLPYIVMEIAAGGCVIDWVERHGPMPPRMAIDIVMQACKGLKAAHAMGVVHRDVKPHNILVNHRGVCRLTDFGIARIDDEDSGGMTKTGSVMGTAGYMAPEQRTDSKNVDARADVYGLGATLYKLLTAGRVDDLFLAEHDATMLDGVPDPLVPVLLKATAYKPDQRYASVTELARALHEARKDLPPDPADTPPLVMDTPGGLDEDLTTGSSAFSDLSAPTYSDANEAFEAINRGVGAPETLDASDLRPPPGRASAPAAPEDEDLPDYIDRASLEPQVRHGPEEIVLDAESRAATEAVYDKARAAGLIGEDVRPFDDDEAEERKQGWDVAEDVASAVDGAVREMASILFRPLQYAAVVLSVLAVVVGIVVGSSAVAVKGAATEARVAQRGLYSALQAEKPVIDDLADLGAERGVLEAYWGEFERADSDEARMEAAYKIVERLHNAQDHVRKFGSAEVKQAKYRAALERLNRIYAAHQAYEAELEQWMQEASGPRGQLAVAMGFAPAPP